MTDMAKDVSVNAVAIVKWMADGSITCTLNSCKGLNARKLDAVPQLLYAELMKLRAKERYEDSKRKMTQQEQGNG